MDIPVTVKVAFQAAALASVAHKMKQQLSPGEQVLPREQQKGLFHGNSQENSHVDIRIDWPCDDISSDDVHSLVSRELDRHELLKK